jgi:hypothetical protein
LLWGKSYDHGRAIPSFFMRKYSVARFIPIEELELERDSMLIELLATRAKGEKSAQTAAAGAETAARNK